MSEPAWWNRVVEELNDYHMANPGNLPGAVFAAETCEDGRLVATVGANWTTGTICDIGTMTKAFTATAVLLALEEHGRLDVETPAWHLPGMALYARDDLMKRIKVRHLLQHTSGLPNVQHYADGPAGSCNDPRGQPPCCQWDPDASLGPTTDWICFPGGTNEYMLADGRCQPARRLTLDQVSAYAMQTYAPVAVPGAAYSYSPLNYVVAGRIVEELTGMSLNLYLKSKLFTRLGMTNSFFIAQPTGDHRVDARIDEGVTDEQRARIADVTLITRDGRMPPEVAPGPDGTWDKFRKGWRFVFPDGGMYTTVDDLLTYLGMLRDGGLSRSRRILSPAIVRLLVADQGFGHTMGFGFRSKDTAYGQGAGTLEHLGSKMTYLWYDPRPDRPLTAVFFSQRLPNVSVAPNMGEGMQVIFQRFVPLVARGPLG